MHDAPKLHPGLTAMESSALAGHHYNPETRKLTVQFRGKEGVPGAVWEYSDVPIEKATAFAGNASAGAYFASKIKGLHEGRRVK